MTRVNPKRKPFTISKPSLAQRIDPRKRNGVAETTPSRACIVVVLSEFIPESELNVSRVTASCEPGDCSEIAGVAWIEVGRSEGVSIECIDHFCFERQSLRFE